MSGRLIKTSRNFIKNNSLKFDNVKYKDIITFLSHRPTYGTEWKYLRTLLRRLPLKSYPNCNSRLFPWGWVMSPTYEFDQNLRFLQLLNCMGFFGNAFSLETELEWS